MSAANKLIAACSLSSWNLATAARFINLDNFHVAIARTWEFGDPVASHITRSTSTRPSVRRTSASYGFATGASNVAFVSRSITSSRPGNVGSTAC